ncbi:MAG: DNA-3-methyladenine glycosylase I [Acidimicrobiia bacterium]|nr:DNA-3-methyladenine glycosylase I [Acidimicrobiia bacterium]
MSLEAGSDGRPRCGWSVGDDLYQAYHDIEWGRPVTDDTRLFEKLVLEGFQAGLAWITVLRKREHFREVFHGFEMADVAAMDASDVERLLDDPGIIRHRGKIEAAIANARAALEVVDDEGSLAALVWRYVPDDHEPPATVDELPATTPESAALSRELKRRGWTFVGPTTAYAFMQAMGLVNDHLSGCVVRADCEAERAPVLARLAG